MHDFFNRIAENLAGRIGGPMQFRIIVQPLVASIIAVRAGLRDAREGKPPFSWAPVFHTKQRRELLRDGWKNIARVVVAAMVLDIVYQVKELRMFYPGEAVLVAILLAVVPYALLRAPASRLAAWMLRKQTMARPMPAPSTARESVTKH